jgi:hypothetical protein
MPSKTPAAGLYGKKYCVPDLGPGAPGTRTGIHCVRCLVNNTMSAHRSIALVTD